MSLDRELVWIGSGGLAHALADALHPAASSVPAWGPSKGALICCIGSNHTTTVGQIEYATRHNGVTCARGVEDFLTALAGSLREQGTLLWLMGPETDREMIRAALSSIRGYPETTVLLSGGATAANICEALSVESISIAGELMPGIPCGYIRGGDVDGMRVISKSGGFGPQDAFTVLMRICRGAH
jgi:D-threonate/D-erythronate kinase